jgi:S-adenosylmethionine:tRNA ribosyltransferase-isomerase
MKLQEFDYFLPKELIAQEPLRQRDESRLMVLNRRSRKIEHTYFHQLPGYLQGGDLLVANDTRVIPARIYGRKETGGSVELFLLNFLENGTEGSQIWECLLKSRGKIDASTKLYFSPNLNGNVLKRITNGNWRVQLYYHGSFDEAIHETGRTPLPPYIKRDRNSSNEQVDRERYQTVYAKKDGAVAAPTAGFHFTRPLIEKIRGRGADFAFLTLHVGYGTFQPIREDIIENHKMHKEFFCITKPASEKINRARCQRRRIIAVGTTATRVLETMTRDDGTVQSGEGYTDLYVYPGYSFKSTDAMITNFHLPMSSLLLLVSAFAGKDFILRAYKEAVERKYRFFSYGDVMLIL